MIIVLLSFFLVKKLRFLFLSGFFGVLCFGTVGFFLCRFFCCVFLCFGSLRGQFCMFQDIGNFLPDLKCGISAVLALLYFLEIKVDLKIHSTALAKNLMQIFHKDLAFFP